MDPEFSERQFESLFNSEFVSKYKALLSAPPFFPTLNREAFLGYDCRYDFKKGFKAKSLMLQFKVSHFVKNRSRNNVHIYDCYGGAYFRFSVMRRNISKQHKIILKLAKSGKSIFYCAPLFYRLHELNNFFGRNGVINNSRLFNPIGMGDLPDNKQHHVSYDPLGQFGFFHSRNKKTIKVSGWEKIISALELRNIDEKYLFDFLESLKEVLEEYLEFLRLPEKFKNMHVYYQVNYLLRTYIDISWFLIPLDY